MIGAATAAASSRRRTVVVASTISIVATVSGGVSGSRSPAVTFTGYTPALNDVIVMFPNEGGGDRPLTIPSGWVNALGGTTAAVSDTNSVACLYHFVTSGEVSAVTTTYTLTNLYGSTVFGNVTGCILRGVDTGTPVDSAASTADPTDTVTPHVLPGLTGSNLSTGSLVLASVSKDGGGLYGSAPAGWTQLANVNTNNGAWVGKLNAATTAGVDVAAANITPSGGDEYASVTVAFTAA